MENNDCTCDACITYHETKDIGRRELAEEIIMLCAPWPSQTAGGPPIYDPERQLWEIEELARCAVCAGRQPIPWSESRRRVPNIPLASALQRARQLHPEGASMNALVEEVGEVARARRRETHERVREELLDVAVVALRLYLGEEVT